MSAASVFIVAEGLQQEAVGRCIRLLHKESFGRSDLEIFLISDQNLSDGSATGKRDSSDAVVPQPARLSDALLKMTSPWAVFLDVSRPVPPACFERLLASVERSGGSTSRACVESPNGWDDRKKRVGASSGQSWHLCMVARERLTGPASIADHGMPALQEVDSLLWRLALGGAVLWPSEGDSWGHDDSQPVTEPHEAFWRSPGAYDATLVHWMLEPLQEGARRHGRAPDWLQSEVLRRLQWYFTVDLRERAPTMALSETCAPRFHSCVERIMELVDATTIERLPTGVASAEVRHALWSYKRPTGAARIAVDAYDHDQGLARLTYYFHASHPQEQFLVDGVETVPAYEKHRACRYFHRTLLHHRIVWLPVLKGRALMPILRGVPMPPAIGSCHFSVSDQDMVGREPLEVDAVRKAFPRGKGQLAPPAPWRLRWRARAQLALAKLPFIKRRFQRAWVLKDRETDADDNAEHLYRWIRQNHPEINIWFLLSRSSRDWKRLKREGFKLVPMGLRRNLLILNADHIVSSHADYVFGGLDRRLYAEAMQWRFTFLQHGVCKDDISHWLGPREFDRFITSSPAEHASIVGDASAYPYTEREVRRTGLPRHDRLFKMAGTVDASEVNVVLIMPTWRGSLVDGRMGRLDPTERSQAVSSSEYVTQWRSILHSDELREMAIRFGKKIVFLPHANSIPFIDAFAPPPHVTVTTPVDTIVQELFVRASAFITDYTSVAFTMAFLRRQVFYFQFDQSSFYSGDHNWRPGYFNYYQHGFGPVCTSKDDLIAELARFFHGGSVVKHEYVERMLEAMPEVDDQSCRRVFQSIINLRKPWAGDPS